ncbi:hypothetical protein M885DRAFT_615455 [Pelagophyceae sp. CCMP2097]|nr:hypothetical protein M885DRAFT_615455 [Pelagophyceae sp. CCMP2097]
MSSLQRTLASFARRHPLAALLAGYVALYTAGQSVMMLFAGQRADEYEFGDVSRLALNKASEALSEFLGKPAKDYHFGDVTVASLDALKTSFRRRGVLPRLEASMDALLQSFFGQTALVAQRCMARGLIDGLDVQKGATDLRVGLGAAVLLLAVCRSIDDARAKRGEAVLLATGDVMATDGLPEELWDARRRVVDAKCLLRDVAPSLREREQLCERMVCRIATNGHGKLSDDLERNAKLLDVEAAVVGAATALRLALGSVYDANMDDVLVAVAEDDFGEYDSELPELPAQKPKSPRTFGASHAKHGGAKRPNGAKRRANGNRNGS